MTSKKTNEKRKLRVVLTKLVVGREDKGFDVVECWFIDDTLDNKFIGCFPFGNDPLLSIIVKVHHFKRAFANIVYYPFLDIHKDDIKKRIMQYNKFDTEKPIYVILENP